MASLGAFSVQLQSAGQSGCNLFLGQKNAEIATVLALTGPKKSEIATVLASTGSKNSEIATVLASTGPKKIGNSNSFGFNRVKNFCRNLKKYWDQVMGGNRFFLLRALSHY